ncbi:MAG TPA: hypothetical protein VM307_08805, partial [Egibacteraceae bacterium]|nr:hypothetical protein [Egibacteraceae bacterium]
MSFTVARRVAVMVTAAVMFALPTAGAHAGEAPAAPATAAHHRDGGNDRGRGGGGGDGGRGWWKQIRAYAANNGTEGGFWVLTSRGVLGLEGAPSLGSPTTERELVGLAAHPSQTGYWVLDAGGTVHAFGQAQHHGSRRLRAVGMLANSAGDGYWVAGERGMVAAFGTAKPHGRPRGDVTVVGIARREDGADGYVLRTGDGRWLAYPRSKPKPPPTTTPDPKRPDPKTPGPKTPDP